MNLATLNRWHSIIRLLEAKPRSKPDLIYRLHQDDYHVSARTLERDLADINQALGLPIHYNRAKAYYQIGAADARDLVDVQNKVKLIARLAQSGDEATQLVNFAQKACLRLDPIQPQAGIQFLQPLLQAADTQRQVQLVYQSFERTAPQTYTLEPALLTEHAARWYVCGFYVEKSEPRIFALDRIKELTPLPHQATKTLGAAHFSTLLQDIIGITLSTDKPLEAITLRATPKQIRYLQSVPLHTSQYIEGDKVHLRIRPNIEFYQAIIALGKEVEVLAPAHVRTAITKQIQEALAVYK